MLPTITAIDCAHSSPVAPGCNGIPDTFRHDYGLTYTMEHEAAHFLGVNHPHDGAVTVERDVTILTYQPARDASDRA